MLTIILNRLKNKINKSSEIGKTEKGGINRLALTEKDKEMRDLCVEWMIEGRFKSKG